MVLHRGRKNVSHVMKKLMYTFIFAFCGYGTGCFVFRLVNQLIVIKNNIRLHILLLLHHVVRIVFVCAIFLIRTEPQHS